MLATNIESELKTFLSSRFPALNGHLDTSTPLTEGGAIDSLGILELVGFLEEQFGISLDDDTFDPDDFETLGSLVNMAQSKLT